MSKSEDWQASRPVPLDLFGAGTVFHHVGIAVRSIATLHLPELTVTPDDRQRVSVAFIETGGIVLELIEPLGADSPVLRSLNERHLLLHLCFRVPDLETAIAAGQQAGFHRLAPPVPAPAFDGRRIAWVYSQTFGLVELLEASA
jgi:methylmalonyl-CoA/ethylmalonyl-CoA epimerase